MKMDQIMKKWERRRKKRKEKKNRNDSYVVKMINGF